MELINNIPLFPFDLERAKKGEKVVTRGGETCKYLGVSESAYPHLFTFIDGTRQVYSDNGTFNNMGGKYDLFMLSPDPSTIPAGAKEKFLTTRFRYEAKASFDFIGSFIYWHNTERDYCKVIEILDWGFQWQTETFGVKNTGWIEFKDLKFID